MNKAFVTLIVAGLMVFPLFSGGQKSGAPAKHETPKFGSCCKELKEAMSASNSFFRVETNGVLYLTVGYVATPQGPGYFDQAVLFCPFCGKQVQSKIDIAKRAKS